MGEGEGKRGKGGKREKGEGWRRREGELKRNGKVGRDRNDCCACLRIPTYVLHSYVHVHTNTCVYIQVMHQL